MVFGQVLSGADVVKKIEQLPTDARSRPEVEVKVTNCGELVLLKKGKGQRAGESSRPLQECLKHL